MNAITGELPMHRDLKLLETLSLYNNELVGQIPVSFMILKH
jgi:hypothetical protein